MPDIRASLEARSADSLSLASAAAASAIMRGISRHYCKNNNFDQV